MLCVSSELCPIVFWSGLAVQSLDAVNYGGNNKCKNYWNPCCLILFKNHKKNIA